MPGGSLSPFAHGHELRYKLGSMRVSPTAIGSPFFSRPSDLCSLDSGAEEEHGVQPTSPAGFCKRSPKGVSSSPAPSYSPSPSPAAFSPSTRSTAPAPHHGPTIRGVDNLKRTNHASPPHRTALLARQPSPASAVLKSPQHSFDQPKPCGPIEAVSSSAFLADAAMSDDFGDSDTDEELESDPEAECTWDTILTVNTIAPRSPTPVRSLREGTPRPSPPIDGVVNRTPGLVADTAKASKPTTLQHWAEAAAYQDACAAFAKRRGSNETPVPKLMKHGQSPITTMPTSTSLESTRRDSLASDDGSNGPRIPDGFFIPFKFKHAAGSTSSPTVFLPTARSKSATPTREVAAPTPLPTTFMAIPADRQADMVMYTGDEDQGDSTSPALSSVTQGSRRSSFIDAFDDRGYVPPLDMTGLTTLSSTRNTDRSITARINELQQSLESLMLWERARAGQSPAS
eukprot:NODE_2071_length_1520_cov_100.345025_g1972_i0.p1 GENE.NODE_2071_length_1520_cov_100.345025_g1972_i0~~NODE_2071_length_1520_cov_100.345025_g1972_i0.p1  ORF type:complete len:456 (+),score=59.09 NODE_2071_length_1520_cov_100.345025_g1972_i0:74-1441(+)